MAYKKYTVKQGDCISSIAFKHGLFPDTIWNDSKNSKLKQDRKDPNVLKPGDEVYIRDKEEKEESCASEKKHQFKRKGVPAKMKVRLLIDDEPRANEPYQLLIDDVFWKEGTTDNDGFIKQPIPPNAIKGELVVGKDGNEERYQFSFGTVDPLNTEEGVKVRLRNLGYPADDDLGSAIEAFQKKEKLEVSGNIDEATRNKIKERFGE